jgi:hypothetical protein
MTAVDENEVKYKKTNNFLLNTSKIILTKALTTFDTNKHKTVEDRSIRQLFVQRGCCFQI